MEARLTEEQINRSIAVKYLRETFGHDSKIGIAAIYCNYKDNKAQTLVNLLASLWKQLVNKGPVSNDAIILHEKHVNQGTRPSLIELSKLLRSDVMRFSKIFVVVDALDECPEANGFRKSFIGDLRALHPKVNLMVTSRFIDAIERDFEGTAQLEISAREEDIRIYVNNRVSLSPRLSRHVSRDPNLGQKIISTVVGNAQKMYGALNNVII
jgi:hypothetical protein